MPGYQVTTTIYVIAHNEDDAVNIVETLLAEAPREDEDIDLDYIIDDVTLDYSISSTLDPEED